MFKQIDLIKINLIKSSCLIQIYKCLQQKQLNIESELIIVH